MPIKLENVGIAVRDIEATIAFFTDLGLTVVGRDTVSGGRVVDSPVEWNQCVLIDVQPPCGNEPRPSEWC
jgi:glyoxylase I family protein